MRKTLILLPILLTASPALAQAAPTPPETAQIERALNDPGMADRLTHAMQVMSKAFLA